MEKKALAGRFRWLLTEMMQLQGIDVQELDSSLDYWEAKAEIEEKFRTVLVLDLSWKRRGWKPWRLCADEKEFSAQS